MLPTTRSLESFAAEPSAESLRSPSLDQAALLSVTSVLPLQAHHSVQCLAFRRDREY